jgi:SAM-dependent methyltransferase
VTDDCLCDIPTSLYLPEVFSGVEWRAGSRGNWYWLVDLPTRGVAVELSLGTPTLDDVSRSRFETVRHFDLSSSDLLPLPVPSAGVDCVLLHRPWPGTGGSNANALLSECARILRPGGCLVVALDHLPSFGRSSVGEWLPRALLAAPGALLRRWLGGLSRDSAPWPLHGLSYELRSAGFTDLRSYYALPTIDAPQQLIPTHRHAIAVHQAQNAGAGTGMRGILRRVLLAAGLEAALFPGFLLIAVR